ncbi:hypothetical protein PpBr36_06930 [Pyricularia pennisetigena]|uniref:hypothetical protein n=1 Tax=Pyricularia pennisetigena TaxID=1578925 RepID=UPI00114D9782|nr:hypothetical protein PpBr36_06930 [Pyricularia pennisetigena]TLS25572.1 hypothetical protein PpBr36_06930 [Pyricularia pennisetigena]
MRYFIFISLALALGAANSSPAGTPRRMDTEVPTGPRWSGFARNNQTSMTAALVTGTVALNTTSWRALQTESLKPTPTEPCYKSTVTMATAPDVACPTFQFTRPLGGVEEMPEPTTSAQRVSPSTPSDDELGPKIGPWKLPWNGLNTPIDGTDIETPFDSIPDLVVPDEEDLTGSDGSGEGGFKRTEIPEGYNEDLIEELMRNGISREEAKSMKERLENGSDESKAVIEDARKAQAAIKALAKDFRRMRQTL